MNGEVGKREVAEAKKKAPTTGGRGRVEANSSSKRGACHQATRTDETSGLASSPVRSPEEKASASAAARFPTRPSERWTRYGMTFLRRFELTLRDSTGEAADRVASFYAKDLTAAYAQAFACFDREAGDRRWFVASSVEELA